MNKPCRHCGGDVTPQRAALSDYRCNACIAAAQRSRYHAGKGRNSPAARARSYAKAWSDPVLRERWRARGLARHAIASGRLVRGPCEVCGATRVDAHHDDYSRPLEVRWLCRPHHVEHHAREAAQ